MTQSNAVEQIKMGNNQLVKHAINIHKFGGSSLASTQCIKRVVDIIRRHCQLNDLIVVSANGDTTDALFSIFQMGLDQDPKLHEAVAALQQLQLGLITSLLNNRNAAQLTAELSNDIKQLRQWLTANLSEYQSDILAFGELWSARLLARVLAEQVCPSYYLDARDFLVINNDRDCLVNNERSRGQYQRLQQPDQLAVVTGYIAKNEQGASCTLGRNGSDYSATIMASLSGARNVTLWTDVDGIYSADPRVVPLARKLHRLPNGVARELGRLGNPVLHAKTLQPLTDHATHLHVASSFDPSNTGTEIGTFGQIAKQELSVTHLNDLMLAKSTSFTGELGKQAIGEFSTICHDVKSGFIVISQAQQKFVSQWLASHDTEVVFTPVSIIATVGHNIIKHGDVKARFKRALKHAQPLNIVNSDSGHSIIAVLSQPCTGELLNNIHHDMTKDARHIGLVVIGLGNIGQSFLKRLPVQLAKMAVLENVHLVGLVTSTKALINTDGIDATQALTLYHQGAQPYDHELLTSWLTNHPYDELVVVDITASEPFSLLYGGFFQQGIHVITANKWAASSSSENYQYLLDSAKKHQSIWLGNTTVGAGLPVAQAIVDLRNGGDQITEIAGIFSGTLSWLFETFDDSVSFSNLLRDALAQGLTEPDPREDLSGRDVQRKLLILARVAGFTLALEDINCQNLVPRSLQNISTEAFLLRAEELDGYFTEQLKNLNSDTSCLRYVARFSINSDRVHANVGLEVLSKTDAFANLTPCDNIFQIKSHCYNQNPLIIRGPGAGRGVTAAGLHSDLVTLCQQLTNKHNQVKIKGIH